MTFIILPSVKHTPRALDDMRGEVYPAHQQEGDSGVVPIFSLQPRTIDWRPTHVRRWPLRREKVYHTVYVYRFPEGNAASVFNNEFVMKANSGVVADLLLVGGGGSGGGGNCEGGGGGGGGVIDLHHIEIAAGDNDGPVVIGDGGRGMTGSEEAAAGIGNIGWPSQFAGYTANGGGYGGAEGEYPVYFNHAAFPAGASGGGGDPWSAGMVPGEDHWHGYGGVANFSAYQQKTNIPTSFVYIDEARERGHAGGVAVGTWVDDDDVECWVVERTQGNDGGDGEGHGAWFNVTAGGGGGAHEPWRRASNGGVVEPHEPWFTYSPVGAMQSGNPQHGGHGVPCDIMGWPLWYETSGVFMYIPWYGGGGAGKERKIWWGYPDGEPGYGGGGAVNTPGARGTGGGGGGSGTYSVIADPGSQPGGSGLVVIRIPRKYEACVSYPQITGYDEENLTNGLPTPISEDENVDIYHLPPGMTHDDCSGDELCPRTYEETH